MASREQFSSRTGFLMAAAGSAIGLGNVWGFPTQTAEHGGAAFVLVYLALAFCLAYPVLMAELVIGRHARANAFGALRGIARGVVGRRLGAAVGLYAVLISSLILSFYAIVAGWMLAFMLGAAADMAGLTGLSDWLQRFGPGRNVVFLLVFMGLTMAIVARGVSSGIERWSTRLMPALLVILVLLIGYVLSRGGAVEGLKVYLLPDFSRIGPGLVLNAMGQAFFSLSLGVGTMLIYGSYLSERENLPGIGAAVTLFDVSVAFLAGLLIIPAIYVAQRYGVTTVDASGALIAGPDLIFQVLPVLFDSMGGVGVPVAFAFFLLMSIASLTSSISMLEVPVALAAEETGASRGRATLGTGALIFAVSLGIVLNFEALFNGVVAFTTVYSQPLLGIMFCIFVGWIWHRNALLQELRRGQPDMAGTWFWRVWPFYVKFFCPVLILGTFLQSVVG